MSYGDKENGWEQKVVERLAFDALIEKRRARRWNIFFKFLFFMYLVVLLVLWFPEKFGEADLSKLRVEKHTALVELDGIISSDEKTSADNVVTGLREAFEDKNTKGVILRINSPGGTPVQASYINKEITRLRKNYPDTPFYAVVSDICASGGYYVAVAADKIYVNESSIVGSIGVRMDNFGFVETLEKLGIEQRTLTAGEHKTIGDPFSPLEDEDRVFLQSLLDKMHLEFISVVKDGRGDRLKGGEELFSGLFWTGRESISLGLADGLGSASSVARDVIEAEEIVDFTYEEPAIDRLFERLGAGAIKALAGITGIAATPTL